MSPEELSVIRKKIATRKEARAQAQGAILQLASRLPAEFGVADEAAAQVALNELGESITDLTQKITTRRTEIEASLISMGL